MKKAKFDILWRDVISFILENPLSKKVLVTGFGLLLTFHLCFDKSKAYYSLVQ